MFISVEVCSQPIKKQTITQSKSKALGQYNSDQQKKPPEQFVTPQEMIDAITRAIDATYEKYKTTQNTPPPKDSNGRFQLLLTIFTAGLVLVGAAQCYIIFKTLKETQISANAASDSAKVARDSMIIANRPWCTFINQIKIIDPLTIQDGKITGSFYRITKNSGKSPALKVTANVDVKIVSPEEIIQYISQLVIPHQKIVSPLTPMVGGIILPDNTSIIKHNISKTYDISKPIPHNFTILLIMIVTYVDTFRIIHYTRQTWRYNIEGEKITIPLAEDNKGHWQPFYAGNIVT